MSLIDATYFHTSISLPDGEFSVLEDYIDTYEPEILRLLLGYELYALVAAYDPLTSEQRIIDLVAGKEYTNKAGVLMKWNGLINTELISLIAYYVYYNYVRDSVTAMQNEGNMQLQSENAAPASSIAKLTLAWSRLSYLYGQPCFNSYDIPSAYNFLDFHESDYPEWEYTRLGSVNAFDF